MAECPNRRMHAREIYEDSINFTVLFMDSADFMRVNASGRVVDAGKAGLGLVTEFPLEAGHVLEWDDKHVDGKLHIAMVRWSEKSNDHYRAGLMFI